MCDENRFYYCPKCDTVIEMIRDGGCPLSCCGEKMENLIPKSAADEKHTPILRVHKKYATPEECCSTPDTCSCAPGECAQYCVEVGETHHPMDDDHAIRWVYLQTTAGGQRKCLSPGAKPSVCFALTDERPTAVYAYCDRHGLYVTKL